MLPTTLVKKRRESANALNSVLAALARLDLTDLVQNHGEVMKAHGGYCDVFTGSADLDETYELRPKRRGTIKIAIKRLRVHILCDRNFPKLLKKELYIWSKLRHANILPLLGFVREGDIPSVISEWMENGTVKQYMKNNPSIDPAPLVMGIAAGVRYLHSKNIVHSDLKADNVLIGNSGEPLICDLGISRILTHSLSNWGSSTANLRGSARWMAPELFNIETDARHTKESDMWAFGMTLYEILAQTLPFAHIKNDIQVIFAVNAGQLPSRPSGLSGSSSYLRNLWKGCKACWISPPERRATIKEVVYFLRKVERSRAAANGGASTGPERLNSCNGDRASAMGGQSLGDFVPSESINLDETDLQAIGEALESIVELGGYSGTRPAVEGSGESGDSTELSTPAHFQQPYDLDSELSYCSGGSTPISQKRWGRIYTTAGVPECVKQAHRRYQLTSSWDPSTFSDLLSVPAGVVLGQEHGASQRSTV